jgi:hypothetical protein
MVTRLAEECPAILFGEAFCDPCAGDGALLRALPSKSMSDHANIKFANEIRPECEATLRAQGLASVTIGSFETYTAPSNSIVITNPPFSHFEAVARRFRSAPTLALLGRSSWLFGALDRVPIIRDLGMPDVYGCPERPRFVRVEYRCATDAVLSAGSTDSVGCAWYIWQGQPKARGMVAMLREPTASEVAAHKPPTRRIYVDPAAWARDGKKAVPLKEDWIP